MPTSRQTTSDRQQAFTLLEVLIVLVIIVSMAGLMIPSLSSSLKISLGSTTRSLAGNIRRAYQASIMTGRVYRLVIDFKTNAYTFQEGPATFLLDSQASREKAKEKAKFTSLKKESDSKPSGFQLATTLNNKPTLLDKLQTVSFVEVFTEEREGAIHEGQAFIHFFPHGVTEQAVIYLKDLSNHEATIKINAVGGISDVYDRRVAYEELYGKK